MSIGNEIRRLRKGKGLTLQDLAGKMEISVSYLSQVEKNEKAPNEKIYKGMFKIFGVHLAELGGGYGEPQSHIAVTGLSGVKVEPLDIPICSYLVGQLKEHKEYFGGEWVFPSTKSATGHVTDMRCSMEGMVKRGSPPFNLHDLRRSFQTYCEDLNVPVFTIKRLVGHALPSDVTQGYIQFSMPMLRKRVEAVAAYILRHAGRLNVNKVVDLAEEKKARQEAAGQ